MIATPRLFLSAFMATLALVVLMTRQVPAQEPDLTVLFPSIQDIITDTLPSEPWEIVVDENLPEELQHRIPIPARDWKRLPTGPRPDGFWKVAGFVAPQGPDHGLIEVMAHIPTREINPADWLLAVFRDNNFRMILSRIGQGPMGDFFEALAVSQLPDGSQESPKVVRAAVFRSGQYLLTVRCMSDARHFFDLAAPFALTTSRFALLHPRPETLVGSWSRRCMQEIVCYTGPGEELTEIKWPDRPMIEHAFELKHNGQVTGNLHVKLVLPPENALTSPQERVAVLLGEMIRKGLDMDWDGTAVKSEHVALFGEAYYIRASSQIDSMDFFALSQGSEPMDVLVWLSTVDSATNLQAWMHNKRAFEITASSLLPDR